MNYYYTDLCFVTNEIYENVQKPCRDPGTSYLQSERSNRQTTMPVEFISELIIKKPFLIRFLSH